MKGIDKKNQAMGRDLELELGVIPLDLSAAQIAEGQQDLVSFLVFAIGGEVFAISIENTEGVVDCPRVSPLPSPPDGIVGVTSVRGRITLVMDLSTGAAQKPGKRRLILLRGEAQLGLLADRVEGIVALEPKMVRVTSSRKKSAAPNQGHGGPWPAQSFFKNDGRQIPVIDVERLAET